MKKITAFFMALFPFLVIGVLFATGLISKNFSDKTVQRLEMKQDLIEVQKEDDGELDYTVGSNVRVIPDAAKDPTVYWTSSDETIATVTDKEKGSIKINPLGYGDVKLQAVAKTNQSAKAECTVKVYDTKIHKIVVTNKEQAQFVSAGSQLLLQTKTIPSERIENPTLKYEIQDAAQHPDFEITQTGLLTIGANANAKQCTVVITSVANPSITETVDVSVGSSIDAIGFKDDGSTLVQTNSYDLSAELLTAPYKLNITPEIAKKYFKFYSSDKSLATIDNYGVITFTNSYVPGTFVEFTAKFSDLDSISCKKSVASSLNYYSNVSFNDGYSKTISLDLTKPEECALSDNGKISYTTYPVNGDTNRLHFETSDKDVIAVENGKFVAKNAGTATLTIKADVTEKSSISDKIDVTILSSTTPKILRELELDIGDTYYYPLRKSLLSAFKNKQVTWSIPEDTDNAILEDNDTLFFKKNGSVIVTAEYDDPTVGTITDTIKLICNNKKEVATIAADASETPSIAVGQRFKVTNGGTQVELTAGTDPLIDLGDKTYIAKKGCGNAAYELSAGATNFSLIVTQDVVGFTSTNDWTHYTTNKKTVSVGTEFTIYPASATYIETSWLGVKSPKTPSISYDYTAEDISAVTIDTTNNTLDFSRPSTVAVKATCKDVSVDYSVTSYAGGFGKFSLTKLTTNESFGSGLKLNLAPGEVANYYIDNFYLSDISGTAAEKITKFKIESLSNSKVSYVTPYAADDKVCFQFTGVSNGTDTLKISNGSYTFYVYATVSSCVIDANLYCLGNKLSTTDTITVCSTTNLLLNMDFSPVAAREDKLDFKFEGASTYTWSQYPGQINLSESEEIKWNTSGTNTLTITRPAKTDPEIPAKELAKYTFVVDTTTVPEITVKNAHDTNKIYLPVKDGSYTVMELNAKNAIFDQDYFKNHFKVWDGAQIYGKYIVAPAPAVGGTQDVTIKTQDESKSYSYTVVRDSVAMVTLPKNDSTSELDKKGLQRVHVYGTQSQYPGETQPSDIYRLEVNVYSEGEKLITDIPEKVKALKTLNMSFPAVASGTSITVNETTGNLDIKFNNTSAYTYTWEEIFNNAFAQETNKNQLFTLCTNYGKYNTWSKCYVQYDFVTVNAVNVWDEAAIAKEATKAGEQRKIVLQTNFGSEGEEVAPFTLKDFRFEEVYGNGYTLCFDSIAKLYQKDKGVHIQHASNIDLMGCLAATFPSLKDKCMHMDTSGGTREGVIDTIAYCQFHNFFQDLTIWSADNKTAFTHIKNCLFFNDEEYCRVAISTSNPGNTTLVENCAFFNSSKIAIMCNKSAVLQLKGDIDVYNFHGSDMFDSLGMGAAVSEWCWKKVRPLLESADLLQSTEYGADKEVTNAYLLTTLGGTVQFYDHTDEATGKDVFVESDHGSEKAANYLRYGSGIPSLCDLWTTVKPQLPLEFGHSPAYLDEFIIEGESRKLNHNVRNLLLTKISRW